MKYESNRMQNLRLVNQRCPDSLDLKELTGRWHAPRLNRWERLMVKEGGAVLELLNLKEIRQVVLPEGGEVWIRPGERWRLECLDTAAKFSIGIYADDSASSSSPLRERDICLRNLNCAQLENATELYELLRSMPAPAGYMLEGRFEWDEALSKVLGNGDSALSWHILSGGVTGYFCALAVKCKQTFHLIDYLSRDHMIMEAAFTMARHGDGQRYWAYFKYLLLRHIAIEENVLFPLLADASSKRLIVEGLFREHELIKTALNDDHNARMRRKVWRLLEAHDEKEELIVYPELPNLISSSTNALINSVMIRI